MHKWPSLRPFKKFSAFKSLSLDWGMYSPPFFINTHCAI